MGAKKEGAKRQRSTVKQSNTPSKITLSSMGRLEVIRYGNSG
jgi:hypothetical protein